MTDVCVPLVPNLSFWELSKLTAEADCELANDVEGDTRRGGVPATITVQGLLLCAAPHHSQRFSKP